MTDSMPLEEQPALFDVPAVPLPHHTATVHFESDADVLGFGLLLGEPIHPGTRTVTYRRPQ